MPIYPDQRSGGGGSAATDYEVGTITPAGATFEQTIHDANGFKIIVNITDATLTQAYTLKYEFTGGATGYIKTEGGSSAVTSILSGETTLSNNSFISGVGQVMRNAGSFKLSGGTQIMFTLNTFYVGTDIQYQYQINAK